MIQIAWISFLGCEQLSPDYHFIVSLELGSHENADTFPCDVPNSHSYWLQPLTLTTMVLQPDHMEMTYAFPQSI